MGKVNHLPTARLDNIFYRGRSRIIKFYSEINENSKILFKNLKAEDVKAYFDWIKNNFKNSIKTDSNFNEYWKVLKKLYVQETGRCMDESMRTDILNVRK
jgi:hypothetical protein